MSLRDILVTEVHAVRPKFLITEKQSSAHADTCMSIEQVRIERSSEDAYKTRNASLRREATSELCPGLASP